MELGEALDLIDTVRAAKVAGSRFGYLKREAALLEFALVSYAVRHLVGKGFIPVVPPVMIRPEVYRGMGRLAADQRQERYYLPEDHLYLVGSAEHTLGPLHMDEVLEERELPKRYVGFSTCFRREAGSYGKDTKGILRVHQFDKVEMFVFTKPEDSREEHERLVTLQEELVSGLGLPYRVVAICTGDMGWTDARQYDIEVWFPSEGAFRETHSASNTTDFQARGINARFRREGKREKPEFMHLLNATALAIGRTIIAILENYQNEDGTIDVPEVLRPYLGFDRIPARS
jgi:seryl-tRNA synthetase